MGREVAQLYVSLMMMKFTNVMCTSFTKLILFLLRVSSFNTLFPSFHKMLYATHIKFLAKVSELLMHTVFQLIVIICKVASSECILLGPKVGSWRVLNWDCREDDWEQSTQLLQLFSLSAHMCCLVLSWRRRTWVFQFWWTFWIHCFNFFSFACIALGWLWHLFPSI